jgi:predicted phage terminase large subunit-like protein
MEEMWHEGIMMGLRGSGECTVDIGRPCGIVTTTPRARPLIRELLTDSTVVVTRGTTYDNAANLPTQYIADIRSRYEGTRLGRQEIHAEILDDMPGAMWSYAMIDDHRVIKHPDLVRVAVGVDPSGTTRDGNEQGIVVCGLGVDGHGYVLDDRSTHDTPDGWGKRVVMAYIDHKADLIVVERNFGGDMATNTISQAAKALGVQVNIFDVTASRGKVVRAEPVSALYEQGRIHHVGEFPELEDQLRSYVPKNGTSPDRMDAMVWAFTKLMLGDYVTLGEGNVVDGARRGTERSDDDEEVDSRW